LPSDLEGMPLSLLEAMSYGNCCLVSNIPECVEIIGDKAEVFKKGNVDDLTQKLQLLIDNPVGAIAFSFVVENGLKRIGKLIMVEYNQVRNFIK